MGRSGHGGSSSNSTLLAEKDPDRSLVVGRHRHLLGTDFPAMDSGARSESLGLFEAMDSQRQLSGDDCHGSEFTLSWTTTVSSQQRIFWNIFDCEGGRLTDAEGFLGRQEKYSETDSFCISGSAISDGFAIDVTDPSVAGSVSWSFKDSSGNTLASGSSPESIDTCLNTKTPTPAPTASDTTAVAVSFSLNGASTSLPSASEVEALRSAFETTLSSDLGVPVVLHDLVIGPPHNLGSQQPSLESPLVRAGPRRAGANIWDVYFVVRAPFSSSSFSDPASFASGVDTSVKSTGFENALVATGAGGGGIVVDAVATWLATRQPTPSPTQLSAAGQYNGWSISSAALGVALGGTTLMACIILYCTFGPKVPEEYLQRGADLERRVVGGATNAYTNQRVSFVRRVSTSALGSNKR